MTASPQPGNRDERKACGCDGPTHEHHHGCTKFAAAAADKAAYCGVEPTEPLQREHVIPISRGGRHSAGNILPACAKCNADKKAKLLSEWRYQQGR